MTKENKENSGKVEIIAICNEEAKAKIPSDQLMIGSVKNPADPSEKFEIYGLVPKTNEECQTRYGCSLHELTEYGVRQLSYRPDYRAVMLDKEGKLKPNARQEAQTLFDGYQVGRKTTSKLKVTKEKASKMDSIEAKLAAKGKSLADLEKYIEKLKAS